MSLNDVFLRDRQLESSRLNMCLKPLLVLGRAPSLILLLRLGGSGGAVLRVAQARPELMGISCDLSLC